jgi:hypothetical protein
VIELKAYILLDNELEPFLIVDLNMQGLRLFVNLFLCLVCVDEPDGNLLVFTVHFVECVDASASVMTADYYVRDMEVVYRKFQHRA